MKFKRFISVFLLCTCLTGLFLTPAAGALEVPDIQAKAALLVDVNTDAVAYAKNIHEKNYPASLTKVMTALLILEKVSGEVLYDDREERPGVKFKDADLVGCPIQIILGGKGVARGVAETRNRLDGARGEIAITDLEAGLASFVDSVLAMWKNRRP